MKSGSVNLTEVRNAYQLRIKPNGYLIEGKRTMLRLEEKNAFQGVLGDYVDDVYRPGIFKRIFINNPKFGLPYITAQGMMTSNPLDTAKILSLKMTDNVEPMILKNRSILVSCAGTIGNVRLIDKNMSDCIGSQDIIRVIPKSDFGFIYAYLSCPTIYSYLQSQLYGSVVPRIEPELVRSIPMPSFMDDVKQHVHKEVADSLVLREEAIELLENAWSILKSKAGLKDLELSDYDSFSSHSAKREVSCFTRKIQDIGTTTINAFNHSERIRKAKTYIHCDTKPLKEILINNDTFSTGSFPRIEVNHGHGIMLINQSDIFDSIIKGKYISRRGVKVDNLVEYGEVLIAGVGTLGENETFCRTIFANEDLKGQLVSGEFIRMKTTEEVPSGYLFAWLNSDYGFRFLGNIQAGTKLCRPIPKLVLEIPVPIIDRDSMEEIDKLVREAHTKRHQANQKELKAISMVEQEIEKWNN